jgi:hypothetical protein
MRMKNQNGSPCVELGSYWTDSSIHGAEPPRTTSILIHSSSLRTILHTFHPLSAFAICHPSHQSQSAGRATLIDRSIYRFFCVEFISHFPRRSIRCQSINQSGVSTQLLMKIMGQIMATSQFYLFGKKHFTQYVTIRACRMIIASHMPFIATRVPFLFLPLSGCLCRDWLYRRCRAEPAT